MDPSVIKAVSVLKLYRDSLSLAQHLGSKVSRGECSLSLSSFSFVLVKDVEKKGWSAQHETIGTRDATEQSGLTSFRVASNCAVREHGSFEE